MIDRIKMEMDNQMDNRIIHLDREQNQASRTIDPGPRQVLKNGQNNFDDFFCRPFFQNNF